MTPAVGIPIRELFDRAHKVHAAEAAKAHNVKLNPRGRYMRGQCPLCETGKSSEAFQAEAKGPLWHCHACGEGGDVVKLEQILGRHPDRIAAARVLSGIVERVVSERPAPVSRRVDQGRSYGEPVDSAIVAAHIWRTSVPASGEIVEAWLASRSLDPHGVSGALDRLRFHPRCPIVPWREGADPEAGWTAPAMIARLDRIDPTGRSPAGQRIMQRCGVHATYLSADGRGKATLRRRDGSAIPARKMWGSAKGAGFWLTPIDGDGPLIVGEGIETTWSYAQAFGPSARACAVLSLGNLEGGWRGDDRGALRLWGPVADPEKPPMTVRDPGDVIVLVDADMKPIRIANAQLQRGGRRGETIVDGLARAQLCATLARQHWRMAGARSVRTVRPAVGLDFNDAARR